MAKKKTKRTDMLAIIDVHQNFWQVDPNRSTKKVVRYFDRNYPDGGPHSVVKLQVVSKAEQAVLRAARIWWRGREGALVKLTRAIERMEAENE